MEKSLLMLSKNTTDRQLIIVITVVCLACRRIATSLVISN